MAEVGRIYVGSAKPPLGPRMEGLRERIGRVLDINALGREDLRHKGAAGMLEELHLVTHELTGTDNVGREAKKFTEFAKSEHRDIARTSTEIKQLAPEDQADRLSGGVAEVREELAKLLQNEGRGEERKQQFEKYLVELQKGYVKASSEHQKAIEQAFAEVVPARQAWGAQLRELLRVQDRVNEIGLAKHMAGRQQYRETHPAELAGGDLSKAYARLKGVPGYAREMAWGALNPRGFSNGRARELVISVRADVMTRATVQDKFRMYERGILVPKEVGTLTDADRAALTTEAQRNEKWTLNRTRALDLFDQGKVAHRRATIHGEIDYYASFERRQMHTVRQNYQAAERHYQDMAAQTMSPGLWGEAIPVQEGLFKLQDAMTDGAIFLTKEVGGEIRFTYEGLREGILTQAHQDIAATVAGREIAATAYKETMQSHDQKKIAEAAQALRGAEMMCQRSALWVTRANQHFERGVVGAPGYVADRLLKGWLDGGERVQTVTRALADRSQRLLGSRLLEGVIISDDNLSISRKTMARKLFDLTEAVPKQFRSKKAMETWESRSLTRRLLIKGLDAVVHDLPSKSELGELLTFGSRRETLDQVLGSERSEGTLYSTMVKTQAAVETSDKQVLGNATVEDTVKNASLHMLQEAQTKYITQETKQMKRRAQLDTFWERTAVSMAAIPVAVAAKYGLDRLQPFLQSHADQARITLQHVIESVGTLQNVASTTTSPDAVEYISNGLDSAIGNAARAKDLWSASSVVASGARAVTGILSYAFTAATMILPGGEALRGFFRRKTELGAVRPTIT